MAAATLVLEAFLVFFGTLVAVALSDLDDGVVWGAGGGLALACVLAAGVVRRPGGLVLGWVLQVLILTTGFLVPAMFVIGGVFVAMWAWLLWVGQRIDRDRAAWEAAPETARETRPPTDV